MADTVTLESLCERIVDCEHKTAPIARPGEEYGYAVGTPHIRGGRILLKDAKPVDQATYKLWTIREVPRAGDLILAREAPVGEVGRVMPGQRVCLGQRTVLIRPDIRRADPTYLHYLLLSPRVQGAMLSKASGSTVSHLNVKDIRLLPVPDLPHIQLQQEVGRLLAALDDKIAVNERIATSALQLADAHFDLVADATLAGPHTFGSIAQVGGGGTPSTKIPEYWGGNIAWTTPSDVTALQAPYLFDTSRKITEAGLDACASSLYPAGSIFMTSRATIGAFAIPQVPAAVNQGFIVVNTADKNLTMWLFHEMRSRVDEMVGLANGSTFLELSRKNFKAMTVRLPAPDAVKTFAEKVIPLHDRASAASAENSTLIALRETLLPDLMSGRLRVKDAEKLVEEVA